MDRRKETVVKHTNCLLGVFRSFKDDSSRTFGTPVRTDVDISANNVPGSSEKVFQILPTCLVRELKYFLQHRRKIS